ncbi:trypsin-like peptidase domain-containing protein [Streptomyces sp. NPDC003247]|uniref:nSTAND1 domain-containing NTPase n=1 Tax=Streptomyces sp. NPDC003247 TaxID=3364677 RepID=UPI0036C626F0
MPFRNEGDESAGRADRSGIQCAVAQVVATDGTVAGAGFMVGRDALITCAHVVRAAGSAPGHQVTLSFPRVPGAPSVEGTVLAEHWREPHEEDVAVVRLPAVPAGTTVAALGSADGCHGHAVHSFGFPDSAPDAGHYGHAVAGRLLADPGDGTGVLLQLTASNDLTQGFSGGPLVDDVTGLVVGMVTAITAPDAHLRSQGISYATPAQVLREVWPELVENDTCPYRGLEPFTEEHTALFHGRDTAVNEVLTGLAGAERGLLLLGPSGSGKSSLIRAGVLPALADGCLPGSDRWLPVLVPRPGQDLRAEIERAGLPGARDDGLAAAVHRRLEAAPGHRRVLLVVDQFEELFTRPPDERTGGVAPGSAATALKTLAEALGSFAPLSVVLIARDDFYPQLARSAPELLKTTALLNVPATLSRQDLDEVITAPARAAGVSFEEGLVERLVSDVLAADHSHAGSLSTPVTMLAPLELVLRQLWERRAQGRLLHHEYERVGRIAGALTTWCNAAVDGLGPEHRDIARRVLTALVRPADPERHVPASRQSVPLHELRELAVGAAGGDPGSAHPPPPDFDSTDTVIASLIRHRIITTYAREPAPSPGGLMAELVHDTLTRDWALLRRWVAEDRQFQQWLLRSDGQRRRWDRTSRPDDLLHGTDLAEGLDWARRRALPALAASFLAASHRQQQAALRRTRRFNAVLATALVLALLAAGGALWQRQAAVTARQEALSRQLAARSESLIGTDPDLAGLLAVKAYRTGRTDDAVSSLYAAAALPARRALPGEGAASVAFSPDGRTLATGGWNGTVQLWDPVTRRPRAKLSGHRQAVWAMAFSPDGGTLVTGSHDGTVRWWEVETGHLVRTGKPGGLVQAVAFSPDGRFLADAGSSGTVRLRDGSSGSVVAELKGHTGPVTTLAFGPDGKQLVSGSHDKTARVWNTADRQETGRITGNAPVTAVSFGPDGRTLVTGDGTGAVQLWNLASGDALATVTDHTGVVWSISLHASDNTMITTGNDGTVRLRDATTGRTRTTVTVGRPVSDAELSPDGDTLVTAVGSSDGSTRLWATGTGRPRSTLSDHEGPVDALAYSPDGRLLATADWNRTVRVRRADDGTPLYSFTENEAPRLAFGPAGDVLATSVPGKITLRDAATGRTRATVPLPTTLMGPLAFSPDGRTIATRIAPDTGGKDDRVLLADATSGGSRVLLGGGHGTVNALAFSPDGRTVAASGDDAVVRLWDLDTPARPQGELDGHTGSSVNSLAFGPDGSTLAAGSIDGTVRLWDVGTGRVRAYLSGHTGVITQLSLSHDGRTLATGSFDGTVRLWDVATSRTRRTVNESGTVWSVALSPDGRTLAAGSAYGVVRLWNVTLPSPKEAMNSICRSVGRDLTEEEKRLYHVDDSSDRVC